MASGDTLLIFSAFMNAASAENYATLDTRNLHPVLDFDASASEVALFSSVMPQSYSGGGYKVFVHSAFTSAVAGSAVLQVYFERSGSTSNMATTEFGPNASMAVNVPAGAGSTVVSSVTIANGTSANFVGAGEAFRMKIARDNGIDGGVDNATGDLELRFVEIREL